MRSIIIDANVFHAFFYETLHRAPYCERTGTAEPIFSSLGEKCVAFLDEGAQIEAEWRALSAGAEEWFNNWLAEGFSGGRLYEIEPSKDPQLRKRYRLAGFPDGKDIWYIKVAFGLACICKKSKPCLVAEDIDFYDPRQKKSPNKASIFRAGKGPVSSVLHGDGIELKCIEKFCAENL